jgi:predicted amidohydrolase
METHTGFSGLNGFNRIVLPPHAATMDDCCAIEFTIRSATLIQPGEGRRAPVDLTVSSGSIAAIDTAGAGRLPAVAELAGAFVLPGLIDMHAHLPTHTPLRLTELFGILYALHGVASVRDAGDLDGTAIPAAQQTFERTASSGRGSSRAVRSSPVR